MERVNNMEKTRMILVRHGESEGNKVHAFLGHSDANLSEKGHLQAEKTAEYLKNEKIDAFIQRISKLN